MGICRKYWVRFEELLACKIGQTHKESSKSGQERLEIVPGDHSRTTVLYQCNPRVRLHWCKTQSNCSGDTFSIEVAQNLLRIKRRFSEHFSSGKEFPFKSGSKLLRTFLFTSACGCDALQFPIKRGRSESGWTQKHGNERK